MESARMPLLPSDGIRRVLSTLAGGILLEGGLGIADPCEKTRADTFASLTQQGTWDRFANIRSNAIINSEPGTGYPFGYPL